MTSAAAANSKARSTPGSDEHATETARRVTRFTGRCAPVLDPGAGLDAKTVFDDDEVAPPTTAPAPSTMSAGPRRGRCCWRRPPRPAAAGEVSPPRASKKLANTRVNTRTVAASAPMRLEAVKLKAPTSERSGHATGTRRAWAPTIPTRPDGPPPSSGARSPRRRWRSPSRPARPIRIAAANVAAATRTPVSSNVTTKTIVGMVVMDPLPPVPRPTGGDGWPVEDTKPASTRSDHRDEQADAGGDREFPTASAPRRKPGGAVRCAARTTMTRPLITTGPMASAR